VKSQLNLPTDNTDCTDNLFLLALLAGMAAATATEIRKGFPEAVGLDFQRSASKNPSPPLLRRRDSRENKSQ
jgi:hypothetical protein